MAVAELRDKRKDNEILLENCPALKLSQEVMRMAVSDPELLNSVYKEVSEKLGMDTAMEIYRMFKGQQISFPMRFFNPERIQRIIVGEVIHSLNDQGIAARLQRIAVDAILSIQNANTLCHLCEHPLRQQGYS